MKIPVSLLLISVSLVALRAQADSGPSAWFVESQVHSEAERDRGQNAEERVLGWVEGSASGRWPKLTFQDLALEFAPTQDNRLGIQAGFERFWPALVRDLESARDSIHIHIFGMQDDAWGREMAELLARKSREGVRVRILADLTGARMGGIPLRKAQSQRLFEFYRAAGVEVRFYGTQEQGGALFRWDHRKYFLVDGQVAWNTGYTLENHMRHKHFDVGVRAEGGLVRQLQLSFVANWLYNGGVFRDFWSRPSEEAAVARERFAERYWPAPLNPGRQDAQLLMNVPGVMNRVTEGYHRMIREAEREILAVNPYFSDDGIVEELIGAARRGVKVRMVTPRLPENWLYKYDTLLHYDQMLRARIGTYLYDGPSRIGWLHAKGLWTEKAVSIGSCNFDRLALYKNFEQNIVSRDPEFIALAREELFERALRDSREYRPSRRMSKRLWDRARGWFSEGVEALIP